MTRRTLRSGITVLEETVGTGAIARRGDEVCVTLVGWLNRGDPIHEVGTERFVVGRRRLIAGIEQAVEGMAVGGRRRVRISPHLAYREVGVPGVVPPDAVLIYEIDLLGVRRAPEGPV